MFQTTNQYIYIYVYACIHVLDFWSSTISGNLNVSPPFHHQYQVTRRYSGWNFDKGILYQAKALIAVGQSSKPTWLVVSNVDKFFGCLQNLSDPPKTLEGYRMIFVYMSVLSTCPMIVALTLAG